MPPIKMLSVEEKIDIKVILFCYLSKWHKVFPGFLITGNALMLAHPPS